MKKETTLDEIQCYATASGTFGAVGVFADFEPIEDGEPACITLSLNDADGDCELEIYFTEEKLTDLLGAVSFASSEAAKHRALLKKDRSDRPGEV